jgi:hypothetical protein
MLPSSDSLSPLPDDLASRPAEPATPEEEAPPPPVGAIPLASLATLAAQGQRRAAWRLLHWIGEGDWDAIDAVIMFPQGRLLTLLLEWLALGTWASKPFQVPKPMRQPSFRAKVHMLFLPGVGAPEELAREVLCAGLRDARPEVRETAAYLLGLQSYPPAAPDLIEALRDPAPGVRVQAAKALGRLCVPEAAPALVQTLSFHDDALASQARQALLQLGPPALPPLMAAARSPDAWVRWHALRALGELHDRRAVPVLVEALADNDHAVAWMAARKLAPFGTPAVEPVLRLLIKTPATPWLMETAAYVLRMQHDQQLKRLLRPVVRSMHSAGYRVEMPLAVQHALRQLAQGAAGG